MVFFHDFANKRLMRAMLQHNDSINDLIIKEYHTNEEYLSFITCSKDNTLRGWKTFLGDDELLSMILDSEKPVEGDLKRIVYLDS